MLTFSGGAILGNIERTFRDLCFVSPMPIILCETMFVIAQNASVSISGMVSHCAAHWLGSIKHIHRSIWAGWSLGACPAYEESLLNETAVA